MAVEVRFFEDAAGFSAAAGAFLRSRPVHHNLIMTLLDARLKRPEPGRYWVAERDRHVAGVVFQSPLNYSALVVPMDRDTLTALADAIAEGGAVLPGVNGDAATAACFAGRWTELTNSAASPFTGLRVYSLLELLETGSVEGGLRKAEEADRKLLEAWVLGFQTEIHAPPNDAARMVDTRLAAGQFWLWQNGEAVSMAVAMTPIEGIVRIGSVYTPPEKRKRGYAAACVHSLSKHLTESGLHCILYTDLGNPTSNSIYRRIGYRAVFEGLHYRFDPA
jgi:predicted GNAT family acetyltransferase